MESIDLTNIAHPPTPATVEIRWGLLLGLARNTGELETEHVDVQSPDLCIFVDVVDRNGLHECVWFGPRYETAFEYASELATELGIPVRRHNQEREH